MPGKYYVPVKSRSRTTRRAPRTLKRVVNEHSRKIREMMQAEERKFLDATPATAAMTTIPLAAAVPPVIINQIAQGSEVNERNGNKVELTSVQVDGWFAPLPCLDSTSHPGLGCDTPLVSLARFLVVWFPGVGSGTAAQISLDNVLEDPRNIQSFYKRDGKVNYKVHIDRWYKFEFAKAYPAVPSELWAPLSGSDHKFKATIPIKKQATYDGSASDLPQKGTLCYYVITDNMGAPFTTAASLTRSAINTRLTWTDD